MMAGLIGNCPPIYCCTNDVRDGLWMREVRHMARLYLDHRRVGACVHEAREVRIKDPVPRCDDAEARLIAPSSSVVSISANRRA